MLSDISIKDMIQSDDIKIITNEAYDILEQIGPASLDFRLGCDFAVYKTHKTSYIDTQNFGNSNVELEYIHIADGDYFLLHPREFVLGTTMEYISLSNRIAARCEGRSSLGRLGIIIHSTAGFIDPGFAGNITLEITNINTVPIKIYPGMRFGQFSFDLLDQECQVSYAQRSSSKYMGQNSVQASKIDMDEY